MEVADSKDDEEVEQLEQELAPAPCINIEDVEAEFAVSHVDMTVEQKAILESIYDEAMWRPIGASSGKNGR